MGVAVAFAIPANLEELLAQPGATPESVYKLALSQVLYHSTYSAIRAETTALLEGTAKDSDGNLLTGEHIGVTKRLAFFGKKPVTKSEKIVDDKKVTIWVLESGKELTDEQVESVYIETDTELFRRYCASIGKTEQDLAPLVQLAADRTPFDLTRRERTAAEKKASKTHLKIATEIANNGALERVATQLSSDLGREITVAGLDRDDAINVIALAIGENERREAEIRKNKYLA